jgi:hypothetical protein
MQGIGGREPAPDFMEKSDLGGRIGPGIVLLVFRERRGRR